MFLCFKLETIVSYWEEYCESVQSWLVSSLKHKNTQPLYILYRVRVLHLDRLKEGTWLHSFAFDWLLHAICMNWKQSEGKIHFLLRLPHAWFRSSPWSRKLLLLPQLSCGPYFHMEIWIFFSFHIHTKKYVEFRKYFHCNWSFIYQGCRRVWKSFSE